MASRISNGLLLLASLSRARFRGYDLQRGGLQSSRSPFPFHEAVFPVTNQDLEKQFSTSIPHTTLPQAYDQAYYPQFVPFRSVPFSTFGHREQSTHDPRTSFAHTDRTFVRYANLCSCAALHDSTKQQHELSRQQDVFESASDTAGAENHPQGNGLKPANIDEQEGTITSISQPEEASAEVTPRQSSRHDLAILFTCSVCETRSAKTMSRSTYQTGVVIVRCSGCQNMHLIADRLGWFGEPGSVETFLASQGVEVRTGSEETYEFSVDDLTGWSEKQKQG